MRIHLLKRELIYLNENSFTNMRMIIKLLIFYKNMITNIILAILTDPLLRWDFIEGIKILPTAYTGNKSCFICWGKHRRLYMVNRSEIIHAAVSHGIYIKNFARCCNEHRRENGLIKIYIPTTNREHSLETVMLFNIECRI